MADHYHHPAALIKLALAEGSTVGNMRHEDEQDAIDITSASGGTYTMFIDPDTRFPSRIVSMGYDPNLGDVVVTTRFDNYWETGGLGGFGLRLTMPREIASSIDEFTSWELRVTTSVDQDLGDLSAPPERARRRSRCSRSTSRWRMSPKASGSLRDNHITVCWSSSTSSWRWWRRRRTKRVRWRSSREPVRFQPDKPLQYVVNTHHHFDHSGGIRAAVSEGLTVITDASNEEFYRDLVQRPHTIQEDALQRSPRELSLELVQGSESYELSDGRRTMRLARIPGDEHANAMLMALLPGERLLIEADAYSPNARMAPFAANLLQAVNNLGWSVDRIVPLHGPVVEFAELEETVGG